MIYCVLKEKKRKEKKKRHNVSAAFQSITHPWQSRILSPILSPEKDFKSRMLKGSVVFH